MARAYVFAVFVSMLSAAILAAPAAAQNRPSVESVTSLLSGIEHGTSADEWRALGPGVLPILDRLARDPQQPAFIHVRAVQAAGSFSTPAARAMLRRFLRDRNAMVVRASVLALGRAFGATAIDDVAPLLAHRDTAVREAAIRALASMNDEQARTRLRARLAQESSAVLREQIEHALAGASSAG